MKKLFFLFAATVLMTFSVIAGVNITKVDKVAPTDEMFMDMAVTAAKKAIKEAGTPCGAVIILNGAWRSTGIPSGTQTAEEVAISKSRLNSLRNATVFTVNEPTTKAYIAICEAGADAVYFVNPRDVVVAAGIYPADAYNDEAIPADLKQVPMKSMPYSDAEALIKK